jgi:hypothetical protein
MQRAEGTATVGSELGGQVLRFTRVVMVIDLTGLVIVALGPVFVPDNSERFFAWTIAVPMVAAMIGAGYAAALPSLLWALTEKEWLRIRVLIVAGLALTSCILFFTLRDLSLFHLTEGPGTAIFVGWVWLVAYILLPPLNIVVLILQERARGGGRAPVIQPLSPASRGLLVVYTAVLAVFGVLLLFSFGTVDDIWPFGLTRLGAGAIGQWFLTVAVAMGWSAREGDWVRIRLLAPFYPLYFLFALIAVARTSGDLADGASGWVFVAALVVSLVLFATTMWSEERRYRESPAAVRAA